MATSLTCPNCGLTLNTIDTSTQVGATSAALLECFDCSQWFTRTEAVAVTADDE
jgi:hypothetical protein